MTEEMQNSHAPSISFYASLQRRYGQKEFFCRYIFYQFKKNKEDTDFLSLQFQLQKVSTAAKTRIICSD